MHLTKQIRYLHRIAAVSLRPFIGLLRSMSWAIPSRLCGFIPISGQFKVTLADGFDALLESDGSDYIANQLYLRGPEAHEPETKRIFLLLAQSANHILDIGANNGTFSILAKMANPAARIVAFEPHPVVAQLLRRNLLLNKASDVQVKELALSDSVGTTLLHVAEHLMQPISGSLNSEFKTMHSHVEVACATIDSLYPAGTRILPDLIKLDAESFEPKILAGAMKTLVLSRPAIICEILDPASELAIDTIVQKLGGYRRFWIAQTLVQVTNPILPASRPDLKNFLLIPEERLAKFTLN